MDVSKSMNRVIAWIDQAQNQVTHIPGSQVNGGSVNELQWMKVTLLTAPSENLRLEMLNHWTGTGALPRDLLALDE